MIFSVVASLSRIYHCDHFLPFYFPWNNFTWSILQKRGRAILCHNQNCTISTYSCSSTSKHAASWRRGEIVMVLTHFKRKQVRGRQSKAAEMNVLHSKSKSLLTGGHDHSVVWNNEVQPSERLFLQIFCIPVLAFWQAMQKWYVSAIGSTAVVISATQFQFLKTFADTLQPWWTFFALCHKRGTFAAITPNTFRRWCHLEFKSASCMSYYTGNMLFNIIKGVFFCIRLICL